MEACLLCLNIMEEQLDSMKINSAQSQGLDIAKKIEKYFWPLIVIKSDSWICLSCWQRVDDFHKFYLRVQAVHMNIKVEVFKEERISETVVVKNNEDSMEDNMAYDLLEPEIRIDQIEIHNIMETKFDKTSTLCDGHLIGDMSKSVKRLKSQAHLPSEDPLENSKDFSNDNSESILSKGEDTEEKSTEYNEAKCVKVEDLSSLDIYEGSDSLSGDNSNYITDKDSGVQFESKGNMANGKSREEYDNFIAQHFKHMMCNICEESLQNFSALHKHFLEMHRQRGYLVCCNRKYYNRRNLVDHIHCHINPDHFKCTKCEKVLSDRLRLKNHVARVHGSKEVAKKYSCGVCGKTFLDDYCLRRHQFTHLPEEEKKFPCKECGKFYGSSDLLHRHMQAVHIKKFVKICYVCGKSLSSSTDFKIHMKKHEGLPEPAISCDICGLRLTTDRGLKRHKDSQHPVDGKKDHHCPTCPKISPTLKALRKHISTMHKKSTYHKCTICQKEFKRTEVLREHMASHTGTPLYTCPWCPKTFNSSGNMHAHRKKVHPKEWQEAKLQKYSGNLKPTVVDNP